MASSDSHLQNGFSNNQSSQTAQTSELAKEEIGWYFVERYYNTLSKSPEKLYLLYSKRSQFVAGVEEEKVQVSIGNKAIDERVKELNYQNCKVRITNVDSQSSDVNIVVQVIGEMTNDAKPHRKFCQTFVLAPQPQGYFLLNDILRFMEDEDEETLEVSQPETAAAEPAVEEKAAPVQEEAAEEVAEKPVEEVEVEEPVKSNGVHHEVEEEVAQVDETPAQEEVDVKEEKAPQAEIEPEKAAEPTSTPVEQKPTAPKAAQTPAKPAVPLSWAQRIASQSANKPAVPAAAPTASPSSVAPPTQPKQTSSSPAATKKVSNQASTPTSVNPPRQPSPSGSAQEGSQGGWQTAGVDHSRNKSRAGPAVTDNGHVRAYVKNVFASVSTEDLKAELSKFGELAYFDVSRQKNSAFVEFASVDAFKACIAANPHKIGEDSIIVEERRPAVPFANRGGPIRGGRGGAFDNRQGPNRGGFAGKDGGPTRGGFTGGRGGRGGPGGGVAGRGRPQAV